VRAGNNLGSEFFPVKAIKFYPYGYLLKIILETSWALPRI